MVANGQLDTLAAKLLDITRRDAAKWSITERGYKLLLANGTGIALCPRGDGPNLGFDLDVFPPDASFPVVTATADVGSPLHESLLEIHDRARSGAATKLITDTIAFLDNSNGGVVAVDPVRPAPPRIALPPRPTAEDASRLFADIAGTWDLDFARGRETAVITRDGMYRITTPEPSHPVFHLRLVAIDWQEGMVELAKDKPDGVRWDIDVLRLTGTPTISAMDGVSKYFIHELHYKRR